jgi:hypothetical protein
MQTNRILALAVMLCALGLGGKATDRCERALSSRHVPSTNDVAEARATQYHLSTTNLTEQSRALANVLAGGNLVCSSIKLPRETNAVDLAACECFSILPPKAMRDGFTHTVYVNHRANRYWILRTGGFAGIHEMYGPGTLDDSR